MIIMIIMINHKSLSASSSLIENLSPRYILLASAPHESSLQNVVHWKSWQILILQNHILKRKSDPLLIDFCKWFPLLYVFLCTLAKYRKIKIPECKWQVTILILTFLISFISLNNNVHNDPFSCIEITPKNHFLKYSLLSLLLFSLRASYPWLIN